MQFSVLHVTKQEVSRPILVPFLCSIEEATITMASLIALRQRIWNLFSSDKLEPHPNTASTIDKPQQSVKRKSSLSADRDLEPPLDKMMKKMKMPHRGCFHNMNSACEESRKCFERIPLIFDDVPCEASSPAEAPSEKRRKTKKGEKLGDELKKEKDDLVEEYKIEEVEHVTADDEDFKGWSTQELDFFNGLNDRGVVPMLWNYWKVDFPTLPEVLFTSEREDAIIKNWEGSASSGE